MDTPTIRQVPGVASVYVIRFRNHGADHIVVRYSSKNTWKYKQIGSTTEMGLPFQNFLAWFRRGYERQYPTTVFYDSFVTVFPAPSEKPEEYTIVQLAPGVLVAYSAHFFAGFSKQFQRWFVYGVAAEPHQYIKIRFDKCARLSGVLSWNGSGLKSTDVVRLGRDELAPNLPKDLLPMRRVLWEGQIKRLYVDGGLVYAATRYHTFRLNDVGTWMLFRCPSGAEHNCGYGDRQCSVFGMRRIMADSLVDANEGPDLELDMDSETSLEENDHVNDDGC